jgi:hypothetical protein
MSSLTEILQKANIPAEIAYEFESELERKFVAKDPFPPLTWEKEVLMPLQQEQFKASERIDSLRSEIVSLRNEMNSRFEAVDARFQSIDERFRVFTWMQGLLLLMIAAIFSKIFFG